MVICQFLHYSLMLTHEFVSMDCVGYYKLVLKLSLFRLDLILKAVVSLWISIKLRKGD